MVEKGMSATYRENENLTASGQNLFTKDWTTESRLVNMNSAIVAETNHNPLVETGIKQ